MHSRTLKTLQNLCLDEFKINLYEYDNYSFSGNNSGTFWSALYLQLEGETIFKFQNYDIIASPNDFFYIPKGCRYNHIQKGTEKCKFYILSFSFRESEGNRYDSICSFTKINSISPQQAKKFLDFIYNSFDYGESAKIEAISNFYKLFSELLPYIKNEKNDPIHPAIRKAMDYINDHLLEDFSIKDVADFCNISESRLYHLFNEQLHTTPISYKNQIKIKQSFVLLTTTNLSVSEIAEKLNFASATYYRYAFRKTTNSTPTRYRKIFRLQNNNF